MPENLNSTGHSLNGADVYRELTAVVGATKPSDDEHWMAMIERTTTPGRVHEISEQIYSYFLEVLPPKLMSGGAFALAEGEEPLRLFWTKRDRYYCRQLTWSETHQLCDAVGLPRDYGCS